MPIWIGSQRDMEVLVRENGLENLICVIHPGGIPHAQSVILQGSGERQYYICDKYNENSPIDKPCILKAKAKIL